MNKINKSWIEMGKGYEKLYPQNPKYDDEKYSDCHYCEEEGTCTIAKHIFDKDGFCIICGNTIEQCRK